MEINFAKIEKKWQGKWEKEKIFCTQGVPSASGKVNDNSKKEKYYILEMFPYPSASGLHMGHALNYSIGDVMARFKRMNGFEVLYPMGFDALGLPAENAAIKAGEHPKPFTEKAIKNYIRQMKELGLSYDWTKTLATMYPEYYRWNQYFFLKFLEAGLIYRKKASVNWCPSCNTIISNEQAQGGICERCDSKIEIRQLEGWYLKTTKYADELLNGLDKLDWPEKIKAMQKNWIGRSEGTEIDFEVNGVKWPIFTTRPDTIFGVTFMVVSAQHEKLMSIVTDEQKKEVEEFLKNVGSVSEKEMAELEKKGVLTGSYAINPVNGERIPIYAGNFVVADYGSGMVMAVPAHDHRDRDFVRKYNEIKIIEVIKPSKKGFNLELPKNKSFDEGYEEFVNNFVNGKVDGAYTGPGTLINSGQFNGLDNTKAKEKITVWLKKQGKARKVVNYKLRDWGFSRQRYWGTPIPIIRCEGCGLVPVPEKDLPVVLPEKVKFGKGNPLETNEGWINVKCPKCGGAGKRETETMDTFFDSSWYFLRYPDNKNEKKPFDIKKIKKWLPVDQYIGGAEHACMHLIYARFFTKVLRDLKFLDFDEPFKVLFNQGMLHGSDGEKMSKSKGNIINPDEISKKYGMDSARYFLLSLAAPDKPRDWSDKGIQGSLRFIKKIFSISENIKFGKSSEDFISKLSSTTRDVTEFYGNFQYRKATIKLKELFDFLAEQKEVSKEDFGISLKLLSPICPHIAEELWEKLGNNDFISLSKWPKVEKSEKKKEKGVDLNSKIIEDIKYVLEKVGTGKVVYLYVMPFELGKIDTGKIGKAIGKEVKVFAVNDSKKFDPEGKAKRAKPGKVGIYLG
ncbi:leucine--tRNA ligase [Candidatus Pacearchaeota archaeon]|nr:leucine--tRNA ligase [Candidatus Pacearchaeota archaeon]